MYFFFSLMPADMITTTTLLLHMKRRNKPHRFEVKVQDVVHVGGQGGEQGVVGPV